MRRFVPLLLVFVLLMVSMGCNTTKPVQLVAALDAPEGTLVFLRDLTTSPATLIDTSRVLTGRIVFTKPHPAGLYCIEVGAAYYPVMLGESPLFLDASDPQVPTRYRGENVELFNRYAELFFNFEKELAPLQEQLDTIVDPRTYEANADAVEAIETQMAQRIKTFYEKAYALIKEYPDNLYSLHLALQMELQGEQLSDFVAWIATWKGDYSGSAIMQRMQNYIAQEKRLERNQPFLDFAVRDVNGETVKFSDVAGKGKPVLLKLWASWCRPCCISMAYTVKLYEKYKDKGLEIVCVSVDDNPDAWKRAMQEAGISWSTNYNHPDLLSPDSPIVLYNTAALPYTVLLDGAGKIVDRNLSPKDLETYLETLLRAHKATELQRDAI